MCRSTLKVLGIAHPTYCAPIICTILPHADVNADCRFVQVWRLQRRANTASEARVVVAVRKESSLMPIYATPPLLADPSGLHVQSQRANKRPSRMLNAGPVKEGSGRHGALRCPSPLGGPPSRYCEDREVAPTCSAITAVARRSVYGIWSDWLARRQCMLENTKNKRVIGYSTLTRSLSLLHSTRP